MSGYDPDPITDPAALYSVVSLSQRDLGLIVPVNFVTVPGVSFSRACFSHQIYDQNATTCLSNLLAVGFRRLEIDIYWDQQRASWSFCPVAIPLSVPAASNSASAMPTASTPSPQSVASLSGVSLAARQATSSRNLAPSSHITNSQSTQASSAAVPSSSDGYIQLGSYSCTSTINLSTILALLSSYFLESDTNLEAYLLVVTINTHAASSANEPNLPAPSVTSFPSSSNILSNLFTSNLSNQIYTPLNLQSDRSNLNTSWYTVAERYRPADYYYSTTSSVNNVVSTEDGWPSESYLELTKAKRLILGFGTIDPQMSGYNLDADEDVIFPSGYIQNVQSTIVGSLEGQISQGCFLTNDTRKAGNNSWAIATNLEGFDYPTSAADDTSSTLELVSNLTACGISPMLNVTLLNATAHENSSPYANYSSSTVWTWAQTEPRNYSSSTLLRCATTNTTGRWVVSDCSQKNYAACRAQSQPYNWTTTSNKIPYSFASQACADGYTFAAPRTALENSYFTQFLMTSDAVSSEGEIFVDFNSLDTAGCWVSGGSTATCPYSTQGNSITKETVLVPTVAAIIVLVISGLTVFLKAAGHRSVRKRTKKRANNGFMYEGVPS